MARFGRSPRTTAVPVLPPDATEEAWLAARRTRVGASEMAAILGVHPRQSAFSVWWAKQDGWETESTLAMRIGHLVEPIVSQLFAEQRPDLLVCRSGAALWTHHEHDFIACTPDYLAVAPTDPDGHTVHIEPVECKSDEGGPGWGKPGTDQIPQHHRIQLLMQCYVLGAPRGHLVRLHGKRLSAYTVEYDGRDMPRWVAAAGAFLATVDTGVPPDPDGSEASTEALCRLNPAIDEGEVAMVPSHLAEDFAELSIVLKDTKERLDHVKNMIRLHLGRAEYGVNEDTGAAFVQRQIYKRRGYEVPPTTVDQLRKKES